MNRHLALVVVLVAAVTTALAAESGEDVIVSNVVSPAPVIDGVLDDACWKTAEKSSPFTVLGQMSEEVTGLWLTGQQKFVEKATIVQVCHDEKNLYVAFNAGAPEDTPAQAKITKHDGAVWGEDCVELFIDPMRRMGYYHILVNAIGTVADLEGSPASGSEDFKWDSQANVRAKQAGAGYIVEMAIPFSSFGDHRRQPGTAWGVNFTREGPSGGGLSTWAPVGRTFATPERFGLLIFGSRKAYHQQELVRLRDKLAGLPSKKVPGLAELARKRLASFESAIKQRGRQKAAWANLRTLTDQTEDTIQQIAMRGRACVLWQKDIWGSISPDEKVPVNVGQMTEIRVLTARNTRAATGFLVSNLSDKPLLARLLPQDPAKDKPLPHDTTLLDRERIQFRRALYIELASGQMIPDALMELPTCNLIEVPARTTVLIWVEIETDGLCAGQYTRHIEFLPSYSGFARTSFDLNITVHPVDLSAPRVKQFTYHIQNTQRFPAVARDLARHGVTTVYFMPGGRSGKDRGYPKLDKQGNILSVDHTTLDTMIANMEEAGVPIERMDVLIDLGFNASWYRDLIYDNKGQLNYGTDAWKKGFANSLRAIRDHLFGKGFTYEQLAFYVCDEPHGDPADPESTTSKAIQGSRYVKQVDPKFRTFANPGLDHGDEKFLGAYLKEFDVLQPYRPHLNALPELIRPLRRSGKEIRTYNIMAKANSPAAYRYMAWQSARDGFTGVCAFWRYESCAGDLFNSYDHRPGAPHWIADYNVVYADWEPIWAGEPAKPIIPSRRWEASYQGNQDYRAIVICRELITKLKATGKNTSIFEKTLRGIIEDALGKSGQDMDASREKLILLAVKIQDLINE